MFKDYIAIARINHWFKSIFILPGIGFAILVTGEPYKEHLIFSIIIGILSVCLISSANYSINEWLDLEHDRHHPLKKNRPSVLGKITYNGVVAQYFILATIGLLLSSYISKPFFVTSVFFLIMGIIYNVDPLRTKDVPYLDVLSESINNPIRLMLGWFIISNTMIPPSSLIVSYWMGGAFLMTVKRYAELRLIDNRSTATLYRKSFRHYTENNLLVSSLFYAMTFAFFFGIFMIKYRIELLLILPFFSLLFAWYLNIGMSKNSSAQRPEELYKETMFTLYVVLLVVFFCILLFVQIPSLQWFLKVSLFT